MGHLYMRMPCFLHLHDLLVSGTLTSASPAKAATQVLPHTAGQRSPQSEQLRRVCCACCHLRTLSAQLYSMSWLEQEPQLHRIYSQQEQQQTMQPHSSRYHQQQVLLVRLGTAQQQAAANTKTCLCGLRLGPQRLCFLNQSCAPCKLAAA